MCEGMCTKEKYPISYIIIIIIIFFFFFFFYYYLLLHKIYSIHESNNIHTYNKHSKNKRHYNNGLL